jgi:hypothetical protein
MTAVTFYSRPISKRQARPKTGRTQVGTVDVIAAAVVVLRPVVVSVGIVAAAVTWATPARADPVGDSISTVLNTVGIGNNGPITASSHNSGSRSAHCSSSRAATSPATRRR